MTPEHPERPRGPGELVAGEVAHGSGQRTAKAAARILQQLDHRFVVPTQAQKDLLVVEMARRRKVLYGRAYDVVKVPDGLDLSQPDRVRGAIGSIIFYEIKSTRKKVGLRFKGYFFSLSTAELLVAQSLGSQFKFAFVDTTSRTFEELTLAQVFARARGIYPTWSIMF